MCADEDTVHNLTFCADRQRFCFRFDFRLLDSLRSVHAGIYRKVRNIVIYIREEVFLVFHLSVLVLLLPLVSLVFIARLLLTFNCTYRIIVSALTLSFHIY